MFVFYMSASSPVKNMEIRGPIVAWYCLLALPFLMYPITYLLAVNFTNRGPVTLIGVVAMLFFRVFHSHRMSHALRWGCSLSFLIHLTSWDVSDRSCFPVSEITSPNSYRSILFSFIYLCCRWLSPAHAGMFAAGMFYTMAFAFLELAPCILLLFALYIIYFKIIEKYLVNARLHQLFLSSFFKLHSTKFFRTIINWTRLIICFLIRIMNWSYTPNHFEAIF